MSILQIFTDKANTLVSNSSTIVYGGKNGFSSKIGAVNLLCTDVAVTTPRVTFAVANSNLVYNEFLGSNASAILSNVYVKVPISQYGVSTSQFGAIGYTNHDSFLTLEVDTSNVTQNTITVFNTSYNGVKISDMLTSPPFRIELHQAVVTNGWYYVLGKKAPIKRTVNVSNITGFFEFTIPVIPTLKKDITIMLDDVPITNFTWPSSNARTVSLNIDGVNSVLDYYINTELTPAIEVGDVVNIVGSPNTYNVIGTSYVPNISNYDDSKTQNRVFRIRLDNTIPTSLIGNKIINITPDMEANVIAVTSNSFSISYANAYTYSYNLANNQIYYMYNKSKVKLTQGRLDEYGRLLDVAPGNYIVSATNVNRYNRTSPTISSLLTVEPLRLSKVSNISVDEVITIDTTGGATINAVVSFPPILGVDIDEYEIKYRVIEQDKPVPSEFTIRTATQNLSADKIRITINNLTRGRSAGSNTLDLIIVPKKGEYRGYGTTFQHSLIGKVGYPAGVNNFNIAQQGDNLLFTWQLSINSDGYLTDPDTNDIEIREFAGIIDDFSNESLEAAWTISIVAYRKTARDSGFIAPVSKFGNFTYLIRVRDTSNIESLSIWTDSVKLKRPNNVRLYRAYNETNAAVSFTSQDGELFPNSNTNPELPFPSFSMSTNSGFVKPLSSNVDNANGSSKGFSVTGNAGYLTTGTSDNAQYITQIRDVGSVITGTIRVNPVISVTTPGFTFVTHKNILLSGVTDEHATEGLSVSNDVLVDNSAGGIGAYLGYGTNTAATYNTYHKTLTRGGAYGNIYAIYSGSTQVSNANSFALIAGIINNNTIRLGEVYFANGQPSGSNNFPNVARGGNSYHLVDLLQFGDPEGGLTFLGPETSVTQNVYIRYATDNVFYTAAANGVVGYPGHGNTNPTIFVGATNNAELGYKTFVPGQITFRYFQIQYELINKLPEITEVELRNFNYEVDVQNKTFTKVVPVNNTSGIVVDYSTVGYIEPPKVTTTLINADLAYSVTANNISNTSCRVTVINSSTGLPVATQSVNLIAIGI